MARLGPSPERGPGTQPHIGRTPNKIVSEFSALSMLRQCIQSSYSSYMLHPMVQSIQSKGGQCFYRQGSGPILHTLQRVFQSIQSRRTTMLFVYIM